MSNRRRESIEIGRSLHCPAGRRGDDGCSVHWQHAASPRGRHCPCKEGAALMSIRGRQVWKADSD
jgi:hypothetical protein